jgi:Fic family protein
MKIGKLTRQNPGKPDEYIAFVPDTFPPTEGFNFSSKLLNKAAEATRLLGKLDGITELLPDLEFFLFMYIRKDAASSSQIEGTMATMIDVIEAESQTKADLPSDVDDIIHYISTLNYGIKRLEDLPLSLRLIKEIHKNLMDGARSTHFSDPGEFRKSQNWIKGTSPKNAKFVPPPVEEMHNSLGDLEKFLHEKYDLMPIVKAGLIHAQFETIHPFLDGNGRTGRILITLYLEMIGLIDNPVLFLSSYFKQHQDMYYEMLDGYHNEKIEHWLDFFMDGVIHVAKEAIGTVKDVTKVRDRDYLKIQGLNKKSSESALKVLPKLFKLPIVNAPQIQKWTGFSRQGAYDLINRFIELGILEEKDEDVSYGKSYIYLDYVKIYNDV